MNSHKLTGALAPLVIVLLAGGCGDSVTEVPDAGPITPATGSIEVTLTLTGVNVDPNGATVLVDGREQRLLLPDVPLTLFGVEPGTHALWVTDLSGNCLAPNNPRPVAVTAGQVTQARFDAVCAGPAPQLEVSKVGVGMPPGHVETITVRATDQAGALEGWTAASSNVGVASVVRSGSQFTVTGTGVGTDTITVTSASGVTRQIPVTVYDPRVLDVGPLLISVVDTFEFRAWDDAVTRGVPFGGPDTWWHPIVDKANGWRALGSLWTPDRTTNPSRRHWMLAVKAKDPTALRPPTHFVMEHAWNTAGGPPAGGWWTPICPTNYVPMGTVVREGFRATTQPDTSDVTCVRADLTAPADVDLSTQVAHTGHGFWQMTVPSLASSTAWLYPGTFVYQGIFHSCTQSERYRCEEPQTGHKVRHVLAVNLPVIIDTPNESRVPRLEGYDQPPLQTVPTGTKTMLAPFTALAGGATFGGADVRWMVRNSPIVQVERVLYNRLMFHTINTTSVVQQNHLEFQSGVQTTNSETYSRTVGVSISHEAGVEFQGIGAKTTVTASFQFGYESMHAVTTLRQQNTVVTIFTAPGKAAAAWQQRNAFRVKRHRELTTPGLFQLDLVGDLEFGMDTYVVTEYPSER